MWALRILSIFGRIYLVSYWGMATEDKSKTCILYVYIIDNDCDATNR